MALHRDVTQRGLTVDVRFWPIPIPTPRALDEAMTPGWRRAWTWMHRLHLTWLVQQRTIEPSCTYCSRPNGYDACPIHRD